MASETDLLDRSVAFLQKRDGIDKLLKILRYSVQLLLSTSVLDPSSERRKKLKSFETSVGVSRKALRLGKFLQDLNDLRRAPSLATVEGVLELIASGGEGVYYFAEQFIWLVKAGAMDKSYGPRLTKFSAFFELIGYSGSMSLATMQITNLLHKEALLQKSLGLMRADHLSQGSSEETVSKELALSKEAVTLRAVRFKRVLKTLALIQDLADTFLAIADLVDEDKQPKFLRSAAFLAGAGLLSAVISAHKNWVTIP